MHEQATSLDPRKRKAAFDRVQEIAWEQEPFIYLVNRNALSAVSTNARNVHPVVLRPQVYWNIDEISLGSEVARNR
jgi:peptide/nickel transport system substrate-binding protein